MSFWEIIANSTTSTAMVVIGGWIAVEKSLFWGIVIIIFGILIYSFALYKNSKIEHFRIQRRY